MPSTTRVNMWQNASNWGWWVKEMQWFLFVLPLFFICYKLCCDNLICGEVVFHDWCLVVVLIMEGVQRFCKLVLDDASDGTFRLHLFEEHWNSLKVIKYHNFRFLVTSFISLKTFNVMFLQAEVEEECFIVTLFFFLKTFDLHFTCVSIEEMRV